jgi:uncharacterized protein
LRAARDGGCPKDHIIRTPDGWPGLNYLCAGYRGFFAVIPAQAGIQTSTR